jgi:glycosyltransferase involved in cell wall biosynthesis
MPHAIVLTVSGRIPLDIQAQIERDERPQADYLALADAFGADLLDYAAAEAQTGCWGRWLRRLGGENLRLAWACFQRRRQYQVIFTDGEQVGLPLAALLKLAVGQPRPRHLMIVHVLSVGKKMLLLDWLGLAGRIDVFFVYSTWQKRFIEKRWRVAPERVVFTPFMVDARFFAPGAARGNRAELGLPDDGKPIICSAGLEYRDYDTLIEAARDLDAHVVLAAASPWSKRRIDLASANLPKNILVRRFTQFELRQLYALSAFIVMPLHPVVFQAGVTTILEAMAMERAVICTRTPGQTDVVVEGQTGLYVAPHDPAGLRSAIVGLLNDPARAEALGRRGREYVAETMSLERYSFRLNHYVQAAHETGVATA